MTDGQGGNGILNRLAGFVPGYKGYAAKEARRDTDRALREALVKRLTDRRSAVEAQIADAARRMQFDHLEPMEAIKRRIDKLADLVRHAPQKYSGFFDRVQVTPDELNAVYALDLGVRSKVEDLAAALGTFQGDRPGCDRVLSIIQDVEETFRRRDEVVDGVAV